MVQAGAAADNVRDKLKGLTQHESECGARTADCDICGRAVMLKEMDIHRAASHSGNQAELPFSRQPMFPESQTPSLPANEPPSPFSTRGWDLGTSVTTRDVPVECPICLVKFRGADREQQLNAHLDSEHFSSSNQVPTTMDVDDDLPLRPAVSAPMIIPTPQPHDVLRSLTVSCPICGMAVHSERDLSQHIDLVH